MVAIELGDGLMRVILGAIKLMHKLLGRRRTRPAFGKTPYATPIRPASNLLRITAAIAARSGASGVACVL
jgi:hypothetical protein